jgi:hypothetical protein
MTIPSRSQIVLIVSEFVQEAGITACSGTGTSESIGKRDTYCQGEWKKVKK